MHFRYICRIFIGIVLINIPPKYFPNDAFVLKILSKLTVLLATVSIDGLSIVFL